MDIKVLLEDYFVSSYISEYRGSVKSLIDMIYWTTGEILPSKCIESFLGRDPKINGFCLCSSNNSNTKENQTMADCIHIRKI